MENVLQSILKFLREPSTRGVLHVVDVFLVSFVIYKLLSLIRGTRAWRILFGILIFFGLLYLSSVMQLDTLHWLLDKAALLGPVALVILFFPELRQTLEGVGKLGLWTEKLVVGESSNIEAQTIEDIVAACAEMSASRVGALIVLEQAAPLNDIVSNGVQINAKVSAPLLGAIFYAGNPLHDGAVVIRGTEIAAAACRLPLSESSRIDSTLHMRHRAAMGATEQLDCIVVVVSEERGHISIAAEGKIRKLTGPAELRDELNRRLRKTEEKPDEPRKGLFARSRQLR